MVKNTAYKWAEKSIAKAKQTGATSLNLSYDDSEDSPIVWKRSAIFQLNELPKSLFELHNLQTLDLRGNALKTLPLEITQLDHLQNLDLSWNSLQTLPPEIAQLHNLQTLYLGGNALETLPPQIAQLHNLQALYLRGNALETLPPKSQSCIIYRIST